MLCDVGVGSGSSSVPSLKWVAAMTSRVSEEELVRVPSGL